MGRISTSAELKAAPERVFAVAADPAMFEQWLTLHAAWSGETPASFAKGDRITQVMTIMNLQIPVEWTVDEYDVPVKVVLSGAGLAGIAIAIVIDVEPHAVGARFDLSAEFSGPLVEGPLGVAIEAQVLTELETSMTNIGVLLA